MCKVKKATLCDIYPFSINWFNVKYMINIQSQVLTKESTFGRLYWDQKRERIHSPWPAIQEQNRKEKFFQKLSKISQNLTSLFLISFASTWESSVRIKARRILLLPLCGSPLESSYTWMLLGLIDQELEGKSWRLKLVDCLQHAKIEGILNKRWNYMYSILI